MLPKKKSHKPLIQLTSIRSRFIGIGTVSIAAALVLGISGISAMKEISTTSNVSNDAYQIHNIITQDQVNEVLYQYYIDPSYLDQIMQDFDQITELAQNIQPHASHESKDSLQDIIDKVGQSKDNYEMMIQIQNQRGYENTLYF